MFRNTKDIEAMREKIYPMLFEPDMHGAIWGGQRLSHWKGLGDMSQLGESWEVSAVDGYPSVVTNGIWSGCSLVDVVSQRPEEMLGRAVTARYDGKLPLLAKFIDAKENLSIQVHPNDDMAMRRHGKMGKSEMWYIVDAKEGSCIYAGFSKQITPDELRRRVADGTIMEVLARHEVRRGDVFYLPAGRIHSIGGGVLLAEIQQSSDLTYRVYDYGRLGTDGKPRQLHVDLAAEALDYRVYDEYRTDYAAGAAEARRGVIKLLDTPYFSVRVVDAEVSRHRNMLKYDSFVMVMCVEGSCKVRVRPTKDEVDLHEGFSCLIPAAIADYDIVPLQKTRVLEAYVDGR